MRLQLVAKINIEEKIFKVRGHRVMLSMDLARIYGVETRSLNQAVKRNLRRFPEDFIFQLTAEEADRLVSQNVIPHRSRFGGHLPYAFTEHGAIMLASVLNSSRAVQMSIFVVRAFIRMKEWGIGYDRLEKKIRALEKKYDGKFKSVFSALRHLLASPAKEKPALRIKGFARNP